MPPLLEVRHLSVARFHQPLADRIVTDVSFSLERGQTLVVLGESGGGKTILTRSLTKLFPTPQRFVMTGDVLFDGQYLSGLSEDQWMDLRRNAIRYVFQEPGRALNPLATIASQMVLAAGNSGTDIRTFEDRLSEVGIADPGAVLHSYPHQLSIGMAQRVMLAMALLPGPALLIADEPTSSIDAETRGTILQLLLKRQRESSMAMLVATHDVDVARVLGHRVIVMLGGMIMEAGPINDVLAAPLHPYLQDYLRTTPTGVPLTRATVAPIHPDVEGRPGANDPCCVFFGRCRKQKAVCSSEEPHLESAGADREVRCFFWK